MTGGEGRGLRLSVLAAVALGFVAPILAGLAETARVALGFDAGLSSDAVPLAALAALPGVGKSIALTLWTGVASTLLAFFLAFELMMWIGGARRATSWLAPLLAAPHAALAIGFAFLIAPSGWIARALSPWATGWSLPPDIATVHDPLGIALILGLTVKELPFLALVMLASIGSLPVARLVATGRALGHGRRAAWYWLVLPALYPALRLPVYAVLSFSLSVVDMAIILGPSNPPTLAVAMTRWFQSADLQLFAPAAFAALLLGLLVALTIFGWHLGERLVAAHARRRLARGWRALRAPWLGALAPSAAGGLVAAGLMALLSLIVWSFAWRWSFPHALPERWSLALWGDTRSGWVHVLAETALIGAGATLLSLILAILWLEGETRGRFGRARWATALIYLPLLMPQLAFLFGLNVVFLKAGIGGDRTAVLWAHAIFTFPYVMLTLTEAWHRLDPRLFHSAASLGAGPWRRFLTVRLPCLLGPILTAAAIGFAVSVAQYLPTLFIGSGRVTTLTTEAVTLSSGGDRRVAGMYASLQALMPLAAYGLALVLPVLLWKNRQGLLGRG
ncbi:ABC transporter permease subunit [Frigidibacter sp. RF13]|uniref:ABC transporter permease n=1 Tax=Frigidibacter sp. RF13 TaxID=2997340 RepID=UPI00226FD866|nr:ABC transporter permease subunit [Frigidibacter sp. RF13]MCY1126764.1 ABC transporter permease subunit [Frigidibacter sp. RF13]